MTKKKSQEGLTVKKDENFSEWYTQVIQKADLIEYSNVSGSMVIRPNAYHIWEQIQKYFDKKIKRLGVKNAYFPLLIPEKLLKKESQHVEGFSPEVAWVTHAGDNKLKEKLAIRPTSETIMYDSYKKWIRSYKDLPLKINQWCNVIRWEFKHPVPFLRTREFLWQEGHNVFATETEVQKDTKQMLNVYEEIFQDLLAIPVLKGKKSEKEKFAGADYTLSVETIFPNGKAIQGATSHNLGQNFAKVFDISFKDKKEKKQYGWQNSWGLSTRSIGIMLAIHGDDHGLVLPPKVAPIQAVIVPIFTGENKKKILKKAKELKSKLKSYEVHLDDRDGYSPGWKFHEWELKGIPIRIEIGPKDIIKNQVVIVRRDIPKKEVVKISQLNKKVKSLLEEIQKNLFNRAEKNLKSNIVNIKTLDQLKTTIKKGKFGKANWCRTKSCEEDFKYKTNGAKTLNMPFNEKAKGKCFNCSKQAKDIVYIGKSY